MRHAHMPSMPHASALHSPLSWRSAGLHLDALHAPMPPPPPPGAAVQLLSYELIRSHMHMHACMCTPTYARIRMHMWCTCPHMSCSAATRAAAACRLGDMRMHGAHSHTSSAATRTAVCMPAGAFLPSSGNHPHGTHLHGTPSSRPLLQSVP